MNNSVRKNCWLWHLLNIRLVLCFTAFFARLFRARIRKPFKEPRFPAWRVGMTTLFDEPSHQASYAGGIDSLESIPGLLKRLQIRALAALDCSNSTLSFQNITFHSLILQCPSILSYFLLSLSKSSWRTWIERQEWDRGFTCSISN